VNIFSKAAYLLLELSLLTLYLVPFYVDSSEST